MYFKKHDSSLVSYIATSSHLHILPPPHPPTFTPSLLFSPLHLLISLHFFPHSPSHPLTTSPPTLPPYYPSTLLPLHPPTHYPSTHPPSSYPLSPPTTTTTSLPSRLPRSTLTCCVHFWCWLLRNMRNCCSENFRGYVCSSMWQVGGVAPSHHQKSGEERLLWGALCICVRVEGMRYEFCERWNLEDVV